MALQLVAEGSLDLDAKVSEYLGRAAWFGRVPNAAEITIRQLMNHTSGVVRYELNPAFLEDLSADPLRSWTPEDRLSYLLDSTPPFAAGEGWDYSDTNYILLAMVIEEITGTTAYAEIRRRLQSLGIESHVYAPLGNRPAEGDFFSVMATNATTLAVVASRRSPPRVRMPSSRGEG